MRAAAPAFVPEKPSITAVPADAAERAGDGGELSPFMLLENAHALIEIQNHTIGIIQAEVDKLRQHHLMELKLWITVLMRML